MIIKVLKTGENLLALMRRAGYSPDPKFSPGETSFSRSLGGAAFPRFHIYVEEAPEGWILKLHLDQNRPKYEGTPAHGGEYEGPLVAEEAARIKKIISG